MFLFVSISKARRNPSLVRLSCIASMVWVGNTRCLAFFYIYVYSFEDRDAWKIRSDQIRVSYSIVDSLARGSNF